MKPIAVPFCYLLTVLVWGGSWLAIRYQINGTPPLLSIGLRFGLAGALLFLYCLAAKRSLSFSLRDHMRIACQAICLYALDFICFYYAEIFLPSGLVALLFSTIVVFNLINARIFMGAPITGAKLAGCAVGLGGLAVLTWSQASANADSASLPALGLALLGAFFGSIGSILSARNQKAGIPIIQSNAFGMTYASALVFVAALFVEKNQLFFHFTPSYVWALLYLAVLASVVAFGSYLYLVSHIGPDRAAYATVLFPVVALVLSSYVEKVSWNAAAFAGIGLILLGNFLLVLKSGASVAPASAHSLSKG